MIGHAVWRRPRDADCPDWELTRWFGWDSWLFGVELERHPNEWTLQLRLGPIGLSLQHIK